MDVETPWTELEAAALLGTERRAFTPPPLPGPLGAVVGGLDGRPPEQRLLGTAATLATVRRAGRRFGSDAAARPDRAPEESRPRCAPAAGARLGSMLAGDATDLLPEWLGALERAGGRVPEEHLPALLDRARADLDLRPAILAVIGERGRWLARLNSDWSYVETADVAAPVPADAEAIWQTGTGEQRGALLRRLRAIDPARARELATTTWATDTPAERAAFVEALEVGLGPDDEPFLESALDDRRKDVRTAAAELLTRLPASRLVRRMQERIAPCLGLEGIDPPRSAAAPFARVELPEACDRAMIRDGIELKPGRPGIGERAWWLGEILGRIPPVHWTQAWGQSPAEIVAAALKSPWKDPLYPALIAAARRSADADWIEALLPHCRLAGPGLEVGGVIAALPEGRREALALALLRDEGREGPLADDLMLLLEHVPAPWGEALAEEVLERVRRRLATERYFGYEVMRFLMVLRRCAPAGPALQAAARWALRGQDGPPTDQRPYEEFLALLQFRVDMIGELS